jgi:DNA-binding MarR family transcriptional regulator
MHATVSGGKPSGAGGRPSGTGGKPPGSPDEALVRDLGGFAKFLLRSGGRDFYRAVGELDLSISQIRILHVLAGPLPHASLKTLADEIGLSMPAVSRSVDALVQRGLVTRTEDDTDRRAKAVRVTDEAQALIGRLTELRVAGISDFVQTLSDEERADLAAALAPICAREEIAPLCVTRKDSTP